MVEKGLQGVGGRGTTYNSMTIGNCKYFEVKNWSVLNKPSCSFQNNFSFKMSSDLKSIQWQSKSAVSVDMIYNSTYMSSHLHVIAKIIMKCFII